MNSAYLYEYASAFERVLSASYAEKYSQAATERSISYSPFFQEIEKSDSPFRPFPDATSLVKSVLGQGDTCLDGLPIYKQCLWAAEAYLRIQMESRLTFEAIFLYMPLTKMYACFPLYHEMDFSRIVEEFKASYAKKSVLGMLLETQGVPLSNLSKKTGIPYDTLASVKSRRRDIRKLSVSNVIAIASFFHVRVETVAEIQN